MAVATVTVGARVALTVARDRMTAALTTAMGGVVGRNLSSRREIVRYLLLA